MANLDDTQRNVIVSALYTAAAEYDKIARTMHQVGEYRLSEQFQKQNLAALKIQDLLEQAYEIEVR